MKLLQYLYYSIFIIIATSSAFSQEHSSSKIIDSLLLELNPSDDKNNIKLYRSLYHEYYSNDEFVLSTKYALIYIQENKFLTQSDSIISNLADANNVIGKNYYSMTFFTKALDYASQSLSLSRSISDTSVIIGTLLDIGNVYEGLQNIELAKKYYNEVISLAKITGDIELESFGYNNMYILYSEKDADTSFYYLSKSLKLKEKVYGKGDVVIYINLASFYRDRESIDSATYYLNLADSLTPDKTSFNMIYIHLNRSLNHIESSNFDKATYHALAALKIAKIKQINEQIIHSYEILSDIYEKQNKFKESLKYHKLYAELSDSINVSNQQTSLNQVEILHEFEKKQLQINQLKTKDELKEVRLLQYQNRQIFLIVSFSLLLIIVIIILFQKSKIQKTYKKLVEDSLKTVELRDEIKRLRKKVSSISKKSGEIHLDESKYSDSKLTEELKISISEKINIAFDEDKIYLNPNINLVEFSETLGSNKTYISQVLSEVMKTSFTERLNLYRVEEAKKLLLDDNNNIYTIEAICENAGFNSSSTFNRVFKKETGVTPSFFIKSIRNRPKNTN